MSSKATRTNWREVIEAVGSGETIVIKRNRKPVAAIIPFADFLAVQEQLEDLSDLRDADAALAEYVADPSSAISIEQFIAEMKAGSTESDVRSTEE